MLWERKTETKVLRAVNHIFPSLCMKSKPTQRLEPSYPIPPTPLFFWCGQAFPSTQPLASSALERFRQLPPPSKSPAQNAVLLLAWAHRDLSAKHNSPFLLVFREACGAVPYFQLMCFTLNQLITLPFGLCADLKQHWALHHFQASGLSWLMDGGRGEG